MVSDDAVKELKDSTQKLRSYVQSLKKTIQKQQNKAQKKRKGDGAEKVATFDPEGTSLGLSLVALTKLNDEENAEVNVNFSVADFFPKAAGCCLVPAESLKNMCQQIAGMDYFDTQKAWQMEMMKKAKQSYNHAAITKKQILAKVNDLLTESLPDLKLKEHRLTDQTAEILTPQFFACAEDCHRVF